MGCFGQGVFGCTANATRVDTVLPIQRPVCAPSGNVEYPRSPIALLSRSPAAGLRGFYRFYGYDMLLRLGGGVLLVMYDELKDHFRGPHGEGQGEGEGARGEGGPHGREGAG